MENSQATIAVPHKMLFHILSLSRTLSEKNMNDKIFFCKMLKKRLLYVIKVYKCFFMGTRMIVNLMVPG